MSLKEEDRQIIVQLELEKADTHTTKIHIHILNTSPK